MILDDPWCICLADWGCMVGTDVPHASLIGIRGGTTKWELGTETNVHCCRGRPSQFEPCLAIPLGIWGVGLGEPKRRGTQPQTPYKMVFKCFFDETSGHVWPCCCCMMLRATGCYWLILVDDGRCISMYYDAWWWLMMYDVYWFVLICNDLYWFVLMCYELLWYSILWWFMMYYDDLWIFMMHYDGIVWHRGIRWQGTVWRRGSHFMDTIFSSVHTSCAVQGACIFMHFQICRRTIQMRPGKNVYL